MLIVGPMTEPRNDPEPARGRGRWIFLGPLLFIVLLLMPRPAGVTPEGQATLAMASWMAAWWLTVAVPLAVTALLPLVLIPALGISGPTDAAAPFANPV
ncbi:MAG: hypothetical protein AMS18_13920, partial [Gemmatimonas sp. SG8_17]